MEDGNGIETHDGTILPREAVAFMKRGCSFLKCGSRGSPHFRELKLSSDMATISWHSPKKTSNQSTINVADIKEIRIGQNTLVFKKNKKPQYEEVSFSIIYGNKTLDLVAKNPRERDIWVHGLKVLTLEPHLLIEVDSATLDEEERVAVKFKGKKTIVEMRESNHDVYAWGQGLNGRVGHGDEMDRLAPRVVETLLGKDVRGIACGAAHTAAWNGAGALFTWGAGQGRLGHDHERDRFTPLEVSALGGKRITMAACGYGHTAAITDTGRVYTWGIGQGGVLGHGNEDSSPLPREVASLANQGVVAKWVSAGFSSTAVVDGSGAVYMWGGNEKGQLGLADRSLRWEPCLLKDLSGFTISRIACGMWHTVAVASGGEIWAWGDGASGQLGTNKEVEELVPRRIESLKHVTIIAVSAGKAHTAALSCQGDVWTWGNGSDGQLGHGAAVLRSSKPLLVEHLQSVIQVECGARYTAAVTEKGLLYTWGNSKNGALGGGVANEVVSTPHQVEAMEGKKVRRLACGKRHTAALVLHSWIPDEESPHCMACKAVFTMIRRRHHCRNCGGLFCGACSAKRMSLLDAGFSSPVRVCDRCYASRNGKA